MSDPQTTIPKFFQEAEDIREAIYLLDYTGKERNFPSWIEYAARATRALEKILEAAQ